MDDRERSADDRAWGTSEGDDLEHASENVLEGWPATSVDESTEAGEPEQLEAEADSDADAAASAPPDEPEPDAALGDPVAAPASEALSEPVEHPSEQPMEQGEAQEQEVAETPREHAPGELEIPPGYPVLEGEPVGGRRAVGIVVSRFNGEVTGRLLDTALEELGSRGVEPGSITVMPVPGAFELPLAAMALAKTRRFACIVALGCVIRGDTPHFDYVAGEAASGLQLAAIETGVPVSFGVLTLDHPDQAEPRFEKGAEAVRTALEMADLFAHLRAPAGREPARRDSAGAESRGSDPRLRRGRSLKAPAVAVATAWGCPPGGIRQWPNPAARIPACGGADPWRRLLSRSQLPEPSRLDAVLHSAAACPGSAPFVARSRRPGTTGRTRWSRRSGGSTRTSSASGSSSTASRPATTSARAASRPARSRRPSDRTGAGRVGPLARSEASLSAA